MHATKMCIPEYSANMILLNISIALNLKSTIRDFRLTRFFEDNKLTFGGLPDFPSDICQILCNSMFSQQVENLLIDLFHLVDNTVFWLDMTDCTHGTRVIKTVSHHRQYGTDTGSTNIGTE